MVKLNCIDIEMLIVGKTRKREGKEKIGRQEREKREREEREKREKRERKELE